MAAAAIRRHHPCDRPARRARADRCAPRDRARVTAERNAAAGAGARRAHGSDRAEGHRAGRRGRSSPGAASAAWCASWGGTGRALRALARDRDQRLRAVRGSIAYRRSKRLRIWRPACTQADAKSRRLLLSPASRPDSDVAGQDASAISLLIGPERRLRQR